MKAYFVWVAEYPEHGAHLYRGGQRKWALKQFRRVTDMSQEEIEDQEVCSSPATPAQIRRWERSAE